MRKEASSASILGKRETAWLMYHGVFTARYYSAVVPKESYDNIKFGDFVELDIEKGKKR